MTQSIVLQVCAECKVHPVELFNGRRCLRVSRARRIAIARLKQAGFNSKAISRVLHCDYSTVKYWEKAEYRAYRARYYLETRAAA